MIRAIQLLLILLFILPVTGKADIPENAPYRFFKLTNAQIQWAESTLKSMSLKEKCAQMIFPWAEADFINTDDASFHRLQRLVGDLKVGGIIFFEGDMWNQADLSNRLQSIAKYPLLISEDFERGLGMRLTETVEFPYNMAVAAADDTALTWQMGRAIASEARSIGVHQNYAPMADLNSDPMNPVINVRAFSEDPALTARHVSAFIRGSNSGHIISTVKHFPGHGATDLDSHKELPVIKHSKDEFFTSDLVPFEAAIKSGVGSVMAAHLEVPAFEPKAGLPSSLSENIVTGLLKEQLGFKGLIVTDAMNMQGILKNYGTAEATVMAVKAGHDMILFPHNEELAINSLYKAVMNGTISQERIEYSVRKILAAKAAVGLDKNRFVTTDSIRTIVNRKSHMRLAREIAEKSITLVKNENNIIPVDTARFYTTACITLSGSSYAASSAFEKAAAARFMNFKSFHLTRSSDSASFRKAIELASKSDLILVPLFVNLKTFSEIVQTSAGQANFLNELKKLNKPFIVMSMGNPYLLSEFPDVPVYLTSYGDPEVSQIAMLDAIVGNISITGKLPVSIPSTPYKLGYGIQIPKQKLTAAPGASDLYYDFSMVDSLVNLALADSAFPGAVVYAGHHGKLVYKKAFGYYSYEAGAMPMRTDAIFDMASVSKVISTTTAAMLLYDEGRLDLDKKVAYYLPEFGNKGKEAITVRNLLLHNSGLPAFKPFYKTLKTPQEEISAIMNSETEFPAGSKMQYSDLGMITLQQIIEKLSGKKLDEFVQERIFSPLGMTRTMYNPKPEYWYYCVPTEKDDYWRMTTLKGKVHDEAAYLLGGVAGHAGLFSTAGDLSVFLQMLIQKGNYGSVQFIKPSTVSLWTKKQTDQSTRALGWDTRSPKQSSAGTLFSPDSYGHTGFTGTSVWVDPEREFFVVLLTNRVHPTRQNNKLSRYRAPIHDAFIKAISVE